MKHTKLLAALMILALLLPAAGLAKTMEGINAPYSVMMPERAIQLTPDLLRELAQMITENPEYMQENGLTEELLNSFGALDLSMIDMYFLNAVDGSNITVTGQDTQFYTNADTEAIMEAMREQAYSSFISALGLTEEDITETGVMETDYGKMFGYHIDVQFGTRQMSMWDIYMLADNHYLYEIAFTNVPDDDVAQILSTFKPL